MDKYDVVIVGSGLGGLLCGNILSKEGYSVCILEKNHQIGGCLQTFTRDNCVFDTGIHYLGSLDEGQILNQYFKYFGLMDKLKLKKLDKDAFDIIYFNDNKKEYPYAMGYDHFIETLAQSFPHERQALITYCDKLKEISSSLALYNLKEITSTFIETQYFKENAYDFIQATFKDKRLRNVIAGSNGLYAGVPEKTPLFIHAIVNASFIESAYRLVDGSQQMDDLLSDTIIQNNGIIRTNSKVTRLVCENDKVAYCEINNTERIEAKYFISDIHPELTLDILENDILRKVYRNRVKSLESTISSFALYISLNENSFKYLNHNYYYFSNNSVWYASTYSETEWPESYLLLTPATSKSDIYAESIIVMTYMKYEELKQWENTTVGKRGEDYLKFKKNKAEQLLDKIEIRFPELRKHIKSYYASTPLTYRDYTGTKNGSLYGVLRDSNEPMKSFVSPRTKISNLIFTGQNVILHGVLGVTIGAVLSCAEIVGLNYLIKKIKQV
ncbi:MAG: all-trans-retinol 13,14-reductase [Bacteroidetes bacterium CG2_30_32_10]|nr:MAG: all-trans-retinol 13,14-reductase [Bacteroidetes bacterium CG2_30_32_10]